MSSIFDRNFIALGLLATLGFIGTGCPGLTAKIGGIEKPVAEGAVVELKAEPSDTRAGVTYKWSVAEGTIDPLEGPVVKWTAPDLGDACSKIVKITLTVTNLQSSEPVSYPQDARVVTPTCLVTTGLLSATTVSKLAMGEGGKVWVSGDSGLDLVEATADGFRAAARISKDDSLLGTWTSGGFPLPRRLAASSLFAKGSSVWVSTCMTFDTSCLGIQSFDSNANLLDSESWQSFGPYVGPSSLKSYDILGSSEPKNIQARSIDFIKERIVFGTNNGLLVVDSTKGAPTASRLLPGAFVRAVKEDKEGNIWVGEGSGFTSGKGIWVYKDWNDGAPNQIDGSQWGGKDTIRYHVDVRDLERDGKGNMWVAFHGNGGVARYGVNSQNEFQNKDNWTKILQFENLPSMTVNALAVDKDDNIWVAHSAGLDKISAGFDRTDTNLGLRHSGKLPGCDATEIVDLAYDGADGRNVLWATCKGKGLFRIYLDLWK